jgi:epoxide hydrolase-like predicted phosphatase
VATNVQVLLFDLGGVLVDYSGVQDIAALLPARASPSEILDRWTSCPHSRAFGLGKLNPQDYAERFVRDWGINLEPDRFLLEYRSWSRCLFPGARELLDSLRPRFRLAALSNSNELHWDRNSNDIGVTELFEVAISSHQVGLCKPDPAIYRVALDRLRVSPEAVLFFDDSQPNVVAASELGIRAFQVEGVEEVRACLARENLL